MSRAIHAYKMHLGSVKRKTVEVVESLCGRGNTFTFKTSRHWGANLHPQGHLEISCKICIKKQKQTVRLLKWASSLRTTA